MKLQETCQLPVPSELYLPKGRDVVPAGREVSVARGKTRYKRRRPPTPTRCGRWGKVRHRDRIGAEIALASTARSQGAKRGESRVYRCPDFREWHLSSKGGRSL